MDIETIKNWLEEAIDFFENKSPDISPLIENNRKLFGQPFRRREEIKAWIQTNKPGALPLLTELKTWLEEWNNYFDTGYKAPHTIDELPSLILGRLKFLREKIESI